MDFAIGQKGEMMGDLKPCPFCGRIPDIEDCGEHRWFIRCKCGTAQDKLFFQKCDAVKAWNKRKELRVKDIHVPVKDCISRQAAIDALREKVFHNLTDEFYGTMQVLDELPSAQPEVIRCKDCKYLRQNYIGGVIYCDRSGVDNNGDYVDRISYGWGFDDFCSHAERRDDRDERSV